MGKKIKLAAVAVLGAGTLVFCIGAVVVVLMAHRKYAPPEPVVTEKKEGDEKDRKEKAAALTFQLKDISVSFTNAHGGAYGYAQFSLLFQLPSVEAQKWLNLNRAKALDAIQEVARGFEYRDFEKPEAKSEFKSHLLAAFKSRFGAAAPTAIDLQDWTVN